ncbi:hypothetical protein BpHYR1_035793 [Brachionus plicatilis]|uniref:Ubiquitin carboxyl-terminal hydrolase 7 n=1 Tax=Brachionus plicatilis TaxID=10195 RepID=A0A3M7QV49_BRAPC|nr:hypothetical protein BpHYR1_035793 [Brachionus plicatilis]
MDDLSISLPCGFSAKYKDIFYNCDEFPCPVCKTHALKSKECLTITKNRLVLIEKSFELKKNHYDHLLKEFEKYKNEPKIYLDESFDCFKRKVDHRREEIKVMLNEKIDEYHDGLLAKIETKKCAKLKELEEKIKQIEALDLVNLSSVTNILNDLIEPNFKLANSSHNISKLFGQLNLKEDEIDDDSCTEKTIELVENDNFDLYSKKYIVQNFEWSINTRKKRNNSEMNGETYIDLNLYCYPLGNTKEFSVKVDALFSLSNKSNSMKDLSRNFKQLFTQKSPAWGFKFTTMNKIMNPKNGFYDANDDSITLKAAIKVELP